jgi:hypothetical protein
MNVAQKLAISSSDNAAGHVDQMLSKPYFSNTPLNPRSQTKTGLCPGLQLLRAMPTQLRAGPKAASG